MASIFIDSSAAVSGWRVDASAMTMATNIHHSRAGLSWGRAGEGVSEMAKLANQSWLDRLGLSRVAGLLSKSLPKDAAPIGHDMSLRTSVISDDEIAIYQRLVQAAGTRAIVLSKIRLIELVELGNASSRLGEAMHLNLKSVDFLVCDASDGAPLGIVQIDRSLKQGNLKPRHVDRDAFLKQIVHGVRLRLAYANPSKPPSLKEWEALIEGWLADPIIRPQGTATDDRIVQTDGPQSAVKRPANQRRRDANESAGPEK